VLVDRSAREHGGVPVKWLGDGVMVHSQEPAGAVLSALGMVEQLPQASAPPVHVGVAAGPVVVHGGDFFGRTVNLAADRRPRRCWPGAGQPGRGRVGPPEGVSFVELEELRLEGFARPCGRWRPAGRRVGACFASVGLAECSRPTGPAAARDYRGSQGFKSPHLYHA
jgi:hypothetical protein